MAAGASTPPDPSASRAARERAAKRACLTNDPEGGVALLTDLYIDTNDPTYLFNQGRCFEQNRRYEDAIGRFREYLIKAKDLSPDDRAETQRHIDACESYLHKPADGPKPEPRTKAVETTSVVETTNVVPTPPEPTPTPDFVVAPGPEPGRPGAGLRTAGLVVGGLGVGGLVTGLVLNLKVNSMSGELEDEYDPSTDSTRKGYRTGAWIGYGAGAACLAGGAIIYALGWNRGRQGSAVALVPTVGANGAGALLTGAF